MSAESERIAEGYRHIALYRDVWCAVDIAKRIGIVSVYRRRDDLILHGEQADGEFQFAAPVAAFGMPLGNSNNKGTSTFDSVLEIATAANGPDFHGY